MQSDWLRRYIHCVARSQPFVFKNKMEISEMIIKAVPKNVLCPSTLKLYENNYSPQAQ